jgi:hypothetical protein
LIFQIILFLLINIIYFRLKWIYFYFFLLSKLLLLFLFIINILIKIIIIWALIVFIKIIDYKLRWRIVVISLFYINNLIRGNYNQIILNIFIIHIIKFIIVFLIFLFNLKFRISFWLFILLIFIYWFKLNWLFIVIVF